MRGVLLVGVALIVVGLLAVPFRGYERMGTGPHASEALLLFAGDVMFDRYIRDVGERRGGAYVFSCLHDELRKADLVVVNLEGPITGNESVSHGTVDGEDGHYQFTFPLGAAQQLYNHNVRVVNLGNNHIMNFSRDGLLETKAALEIAGVEYFGEPNQGESERVLRKEVNGIPLSFVNWSDWTSDKTDHTVAQVRKEKEAGRLPIVYAHWGDEYAPAPERTKVLARQFVDAGAELVVGSHSHIEGEHEVYKGKEIYYSLGNFIFDQYFSEEVRNGIMVWVIVTPGGVVRTARAELRLETDGRTCLRTSDDE